MNTQPFVYDKLPCASTIVHKVNITHRCVYALCIYLCIRIIAKQFNEYFNFSLLIRHYYTFFSSVSLCLSLKILALSASFNNVLEGENKRYCT